MTNEKLNLMIDKESKRQGDKESKVLGMMISFANEDATGYSCDYPIIFRAVVNAKDDKFVDALEFRNDGLYSMRSLAVGRQGTAEGMNPIQVNEEDLYTEEEALKKLVDTYSIDFGAPENSTFVREGVVFTEKNIGEAWDVLIQLRKDGIERQKYHGHVVTYMKMLEQWSYSPEYKDRIPANVRAVMQNLTQIYKKLCGELC